MKRRYQYSRRELMRRGARLVSTLATASAVAPFGSLNALAQGSDYKALVCIFNFGGNDSNNMWVTRGPQYARYQAERQGLAIPMNTLLPVVTPSDEPFGFHPSLAAIHPLWATKQLAVVQNVGTLVRPLTRAEYQARTKPAPMNLFSHSDQQQQWQNASPLAPLTTGWGGRIADKVQGLNSPSNFPPTVAISGNSLQLVGAETRPTSINGDLALEGNDGTTVGNARQTSLQQILEFDTGVALFQAASRVVKDAIEVARQVDAATRNTNPLPVVFPNTSLGNQLQQVAKIIQVRSALGMRRQIFFVTQGGYDTHNDQAGNHAGLLLEMAQAMLAFYQATVALGVAEQVVTFNESDFNRTFNPNNGAGTDHAWGGHYLVMGGGVKGGDAYGRYPELIKQGPDDSGSRGNWIPTTSLDQYGATMASWFGVSELDMPSVFPNINNFATKKLGFL